MARVSRHMRMCGAFIACLPVAAGCARLGYTDPALWPRNRSLKMLKERFSFELHSVVVDTGESPLEDDDPEE